MIRDEIIYEVQTRFWGVQAESKIFELGPVYVPYDMFTPHKHNGQARLDYSDLGLPPSDREILTPRQALAWVTGTRCWHLANQGITERDAVGLLEIEIRRWWRYTLGDYKFKSGACYQGRLPEWPPKTHPKKYTAPYSNYR